MLARTLAALIAACALLTPANLASAQSDDGNAERMQILRGGAYRKTNFNALGFSGSDATRERVSYTGREPAGTIVIITAERRLYYVQEGGNALKYTIGVGRTGFQWRGTHKVSAKKEWPTWTPPPEMHRRQKGLPAQMKGGEDNPLGARAMYLGSTLYRIHGSNDPDSIGQAESSGCFRMTNDDVKDLYERVAIGTTVIVR
jgi:lipoprotein-anchoring transpeptidase ErfK/SrfK